MTTLAPASSTPSALEAVLQRIHAIYEKELYGLKTFQKFYTQKAGVPSETFAEEIEKKEKQYHGLQQRLGRLQEQQSKEKHHKYAHQDRRGAEYRLIQLETGRGTSSENRTPRQQEIVNEVVSEMIPYFRYIADRLLNPGVYNLRRGKINRPITIGGNKVSLGEVSKQFSIIEDLVQESALVITEKFHRYNPSRGGIITFAYIWAVSTMLRYAAEKCSIIRIPLNISDVAKKIYRQRSRRDFFKQVEEEIRESSLTVPAHLQVAAIYLALQGGYVNIWGPISSRGDGSHRGNFEEIYLPDEETPSPEEEKVFQERKQSVRNILETLTPREHEILRRRFGFEDGEVKSLEEIGLKFNVTRERIRQIEAKALGKLRHPSSARKLRMLIT